MMLSYFWTLLLSLHWITKTSILYCPVTFVKLNGMMFSDIITISNFWQNGVQWPLTSSVQLILNFQDVHSIMAPSLVKRFMGDIMYSDFENLNVVIDYWCWLYYLNKLHATYFEHILIIELGALPTNLKTKFCSMYSKHGGCS